MGWGGMAPLQPSSFSLPVHMVAWLTQQWALQTGIDVQCQISKWGASQVFTCGLWFS